MKQPLCLSCVSLKQEEVEEVLWEKVNGKPTLVRTIVIWHCNKRQQDILTAPTTCKNYLPLTQTKLTIGDDGMVKVDEIPSEGARIDLKDLPNEADLIVTGEKMIEATAGKTGGLALTYQLRDGRSFTQKYSKVSGAELITALKKLGYATTEPLSKHWHHYKLVAMRIGFPRMIPQNKVKEEKA